MSEKSPAPCAFDIEVTLEPRQLEPEHAPIRVICGIRVIMLAEAGQDELTVTNSRIVVSFHEGVLPGLLFQVSPKQRPLFQLGQQAELRIGNIEQNQEHTFHLEFEAPRHAAGTVELAGAEIQYDVPTHQLRNQRRKVSITMSYGEPRAGADPGAGDRFDVVLIDVGNRPIKVARAIRDTTGLSLTEVKTMLEEGVVLIANELRLRAAVAIQQRVQQAGADCRVRLVRQTSDSGRQGGKRSG